MVNHVKLICLSVGLLVALGGLSSVSSAPAQREIKKPAVVTAVTLQAAQSRVITAAAFRAVTFSY